MTVWQELREWQRLVLIVALAPFMLVLYIVLALMCGIGWMVKGR